ncbi:molecular chaperone [Novosphingobium sp. fls2-241-R2A-195]|nr:molecular chaperone [Novosphingobium sp. fls2-241-R2A-195]
MRLFTVLRRLPVFGIFLLLPDFAYSQSTNSVVIWPVNPVIESGERATPLRLENPGTRPILMQIRIFGWQQIDGDERFVEQKEVTGTPPMVRIEAGQQQLIRLTRIAPPSDGERSYRVIIDEIPIADTPAQPGTGEPRQAAAAIQFRMRYSLPLFTYGTGDEARSARDRAKDRAGSAPALEWRVVETGGATSLEVHNPGTRHSRLTTVTMKRADGTSLKLDGAHGYVLAGATMRFAITQAIAPQARLFAEVEGDSSSPMTHRQP